MSTLKINLGAILSGEELEYKERVNIEIDDNNRILHIGNGYDSSAKNFKEFILVPPLINFHTHSGDFTFPEIGIDKTIKELVGDPHSEKYKYFKLYKDKVNEGIREFIRKSINFGIIGILDFREEGVEGVLKAKKSIDLIDIHYFSLGRLDKFDEKELEALAKVAEGYGLPSPSYHSRKELNVIKNHFATKIRAIHFAETKKQYLRDSLEEIIVSYSPNLIIHGTHFSINEFYLLKNEKIPLVVCPRSNLWFGIGMPNISAAYDVGVTVFYGSDNGSWISPNLWKDLELALLITRIQKPGSNYARDILSSATVNAYNYLRLDFTIKEGNKIYPVLIRGDEIFRANDKFVAIIKRASDNGIYSLGAIQNIS
ncbi:hypothetical protein EWF20_03170 [Sulfolobus sp. S-194]|uniref:amidohydrolase family protein n=1 Tax=Sulfolobus sp. S-194 TaxID=2512240 RepID=UPI001436D7DF|nr:amidohydrolase family protein [Sulfolobus sp. S-194]QIW23242.1 hypothetical protein EWF20_03170 [Sulfolobus sp. S-194]